MAVDACKSVARGTETETESGARDGDGGKGGRDGEAGKREGAKDGERGDVCTLKYYSQMKYRVGPGGTARVYF